VLVRERLAGPPDRRASLLVNAAWITPIVLKPCPSGLCHRTFLHLFGSMDLMRGSHLKYADDRTAVRHLETFRPARACRVRMSILSREVLLLLAFVGGAGFLIAATQDTEPLDEPGRTSLPGHDNLLESLAFTRDGRTLISCGWDQKVRFWAVDENRPGWGHEIENLTSASHLFSATVTPDSQYLAAGGVDGLYLWSRAANHRWKPILLCSGINDRTLALASDGRTLALGCGDGSIRLWDLAARKVSMVLGGFADELRKVDLSPNGTFVAGSTFGGEFKLWELKPGVQPRKPALDLDQVQTFTFAPDNATLAIAQGGDRWRCLSLWDVRTCRVLHRLSENAAGVNALAISPDSRIMASADVDESIRLWDIASGRLIATFREGVGWIKAIVFSPDGRRLAFGGRDGAVYFRALDLEGEAGRPNRS
jgi:WD40 repeat protein